MFERHSFRSSRVYSYAQVSQRYKNLQGSFRSACRLCSIKWFDALCYLSSWMSPTPPRQQSNYLAYKDAEVDKVTWGTKTIGYRTSAAHRFGKPPVNFTPHRETLLYNQPQQQPVTPKFISGRSLIMASKVSRNLSPCSMAQAVARAA